VDYQLHWNTTEYGGVESIRIHPKLLWTPDLLMYNRWEYTGSLFSA
jgi:nicotinic acetylcholine receptor